MLRMLLAFAVTTLFFTTGPADAQERLRVGVVERPPFAMRTADGAWSGMAIDLWRFAAEDLGLSYEYVTVEDIDALERGDVDLIMPVYSTPDLARRFELSQPLYTATMGIAAPVNGRLMSVVTGFASWQFARLLIGLSALLLVVGAVIWLLERGRNEDQFARNPMRGLGDGFWWAGVTLTTIGYGDKAPRTLAGRAVAMLWMLVGLAVSAALTASIVNLSGVDREIDVPEAFAGNVVGAVENGTAAAFLANEDVHAELFADMNDALAALDAGSVDMVAGASPALQHAIREDGSLDFTVRTTQLDPHYVAIALPRDADITGPLEAALLARLTAESGWSVMKRYVPQ